VRKTELQRFKKVFEKQRNDILLNVKVLDEGLYIRDDARDEADQASSGIEQQMCMQMKSREAATLRLVNEAIRRIDLGIFGECESCGDAIEPKRLQARPTTAMCIACKEEEEKKSGATVIGRGADFLH
jgi:DnaK suppressor protein